jgi:hypothetical protein
MIADAIFSWQLACIPCAAKLSKNKALEDNQQ